MEELRLMMQQAAEYIDFQDEQMTELRNEVYNTIYFVKHVIYMILCLLMLFYFYTISMFVRYLLTG